MALTRRQREVYDFVIGFVEEQGYSPSLEEIGAHFGLRSVATVHKHVQHLVEKGLLRKAWNRSRSVEAIEELLIAASPECTAPDLGREGQRGGGPIELAPGDDDLESDDADESRGGGRGSSGDKESSRGGGRPD